MISEDRLKAIAFNAIIGLKEFVGFESSDVKRYCSITDDEYREIMGYQEED